MVTLIEKYSKKKKQSKYKLVVKNMKKKIDNQKIKLQSLPVDD
jgi:hypothetical protein